MSFEIGGVEVFSLDEISRKLGVDTDSLRKIIRKGDLVARKIGDQYFVTSQNLLAFLATAPSPGNTRKQTRPPKGGAEKAPAPAAEEPAGLADMVDAADPPADVAPPAPPPRSERPATDPPRSAPVAPRPQQPPTEPPPPAGRPDPAEALKALFDMPLLPPEIDVASAALTPEEKRRQAVEATRRRAGQKEGEAPGDNPLEERRGRSLIDSEELPVPIVDTPGGSRPTETRTAVRTGKATEPPAAPEGTEVPRLTSVPDMFGPESPTLVYRPDAAGTPAPSIESLEDAVAQARAARQERDRVITRIRKLPTAEQEKELGGPVGEDLVRLDRMIEEGDRAARELGRSAPALPPTEGALAVPAIPVSDVPPMPVEPPPLPVAVEPPAAEAIPDPVVAAEPPPIPAPAAPEPAPAPAPESRVAKAPFEEIPPAPEARADKEPPPPEVTAHEAMIVPIPVPKDETKWLPAGKPISVDAPAAQPAAPGDPFALISPQTPPPGTPASAPGAPPGKLGGESWSEVGLPSANAGKKAEDYQFTRGEIKKVERVTLTLTDDERRLLSDHGVAEATAIHEIMEKFQPTDEKSWEYAKHRYFQPIRMKSLSW